MNSHSTMAAIFNTLDVLLRALLERSHRVSYLASVVLIGAAAGVTHAGPTRWSVDTEANYQGIPLNPSPISETLPTRRVTSDSFVNPPMDGFSSAHAMGRSEGFSFPTSPTFQGADLSALTRAAGYDPSFGPPDNVLNANSKTKSHVHWHSVLGSLTRGRPITVEVTLATSGQIAATQFVDPSFVAESIAEIKLQLAGGLGGLIDHHGMVTANATGDDTPPTLTVQDDWAGDFTLGQPIVTPLGAIPKYEIQTVDTFLFNSRLGDPFLLDFSLDASTESGGPFEVYTLSDFAANYRFRALDPSTGTPIVDPVTGLPLDDLFQALETPDLNMDGAVDGLDLGILLGNFDQNGIPASGGELNDTDPVDGLDLGILLGAWNPPPPPGRSSAVPEPASMALLALAGAALVATRRFRNLANG